MWLWRIHSCGLPVFFGVLLCGSGATTVVPVHVVCACWSSVRSNGSFCLFVFWERDGRRLASSFLREDLYFRIYLCNW